MVHIILTHTKNEKDYRYPFFSLFNADCTAIPQFARNIFARFIQKTCKNILTMLKMRDIITNVVKPTQAIHETKLFQMTEKVKHFLHLTANIP